MSELRASSVSAALRRCGFVCSHDRNREGIRVTGGTAAWNPVTVTADLDLPRHARVLTDQLEAALRELGHAVERTSENSVTVRRAV